MMGAPVVTATQGMLGAVHGSRLEASALGEGQCVSVTGAQICHGAAGC